MANHEVHGTQYVFGFTASNAPTITGFSARRAELTFEPEVLAEAKDGEGHTESIALSKKTYRKITGSFTGYILTTLGSGTGGSNDIATYFNFTVNGVSRHFIVTGISEPRPKGEFVEVTLNVMSVAGVTPASTISA